MANNIYLQKLAESSLYEKIIFTESELLKIKEVLDNWYTSDETIDIFCIQCKQYSTYKPSQEGQLPSTKNTAGALICRLTPFTCLHFRCTRSSNHYFGFQIFYDEKHIIKIGQYPSKADIELPDLEKYSKVITSEVLADFKRSIGLASHGIGAGSFVYLRRVLENLINLAYKKAQNDSKFNKEKYHKSRFNEKIVLLKNYLPDVVVQNKESYSILSKGVHELSEDECLKNFELMKSTIEIILDEVLSETIKNEKNEIIKKSINNLHSKLKAP